MDIRRIKKIDETIFFFFSSLIDKYLPPPYFKFLSRWSRPPKPNRDKIRVDRFVPKNLFWLLSQHDLF